MSAPRPADIRCTDARFKHRHAVEPDLGDGCRDAGQYKGDICCPADARFEHPAAPDRNTGHVRDTVDNALPTRRIADVLLEVWRVNGWDGDTVNAAPDEHDAFGWFSLDEATSLDLADDEYPALFKQVLT
ncbi:NUDIX hydrolase [Cryobacterium sp. TMT1-62]|uniref:NUDIX hydrolase n=1 Tax=unclassified Cryobacterium TaxID=2649013 RepID=UPI0010693F19|nr:MULTISPECIES: NUDIX hydrolase [unclassified Cryobacterium]TFC54768.1 NUDIX hydrolase [Cryobacterium sp. TMT2-17-1]TFD36354.1 NUDIX hydrolase [Cryobacterium sp. TMT1-62]